MDSILALISASLKADASADASTPTALKELIAGSAYAALLGKMSTEQVKVQQWLSYYYTTTGGVKDLSVLDKHLARKSYFASGSNYTLADVVVYKLVSESLDKLAASDLKNLKRYRETHPHQHPRRLVLFALISAAASASNTPTNTAQRSSLFYASFRLASFPSFSSLPAIACTLNVSTVTAHRCAAQLPARLLYSSYLPSLTWPRTHLPRTSHHHHH
jgi:hypothetical protein